MPAPTADTLNQITSIILSAAIGIHRALGPGLLESAYLTCLIHELVAAQLRIERQKALPLVYRGVTIECSYRADLVVEESVLIEVKALETLGNSPVGLLLNFGAPTMKAGIKRIVNGFPEK